MVPAVKWKCMWNGPRNVTLRAGLAEIWTEFLSATERFLVDKPYVFGIIDSTHAKLQRL
jgi:hypothetical protein